MSTELATQETNAIATRVAARSAIEMTAEQTEFTPQQVAALKQLGLEDVPVAQLDLFHHRCQVTRLDPFSRQIHLIGRRTKVGGYNGEPERYETKYTIQTGIDGYRLNGKRAAKQAGDRLGLDGPYWHDGNGWSDVWLGGTKPPAAAKYTIFVNGEPYTGIANYSEFVQTTGYGSQARPNAMWSKMPANQLAKCAEAQAWRRAYPDDFSNLHLEDAALVIDPNGEAAPVRAQAQRLSAGELTATASTGPTVQPWHPTTDDRSVPRTDPAENPDTPPVQGSATVTAGPAENTAPAKRGRAKKAAAPLITPEQLAQADQHFAALGLTDRADRLRLASSILGREVTDGATLTHAEADWLLAELADARSVEAFEERVVAAAEVVHAEADGGAQ
ncbi:MULTISPECIES: recombinase RecT [unclassified Nocardia]|uniref:recombinase RecT n=1 Tax=unclassified Nocardia TaxID=2637762 RepID=UPI00278C89E8|nr:MULTISPECIES: recombinase RecT [unclassified Nocardia]